MKMLLFAALLLVALPVTLALELKRVQVVTRHGARTTLEPFPGETEDWVCDEIGTVAFSTFSAGTTAHVTHMLAVYNSPYPTLKGGSCIQGILTKEGRAQHEQLGTKLRARYAAFLPDTFMQDAFFIRSTNFERTKQSAMSLLLGMYPELRTSQHLVSPRVMPIIHIAEAGDWLVPDDCPSVLEAINYFIKDRAYQTLLAKHAESQARLSRLAGFNGTVSWGVLHDNLVARMAMGIPLMKGFTPADVDEAEVMHDAKYRVVNCRADIGERQRYIRPVVGRFLKLLTTTMLDAKRPEKFFLFSAHDTTVAPIMAALADPDAYACGQPPYAANIVFELYAHGDQKYVRVLYNDRPLVPWFCTGVTVNKVDSLCSVEEYVAGISQFYSTDYQVECYRTAWP